MSGNRIDLGGRRAIVTGGASGIGLATVRRMLDSGAAVAVWDASQAALDRADSVLGGRRDDVVLHRVDVSDWDAVVSASAVVRKRLGGLDILVNSAGIADGHHPVQEYPMEAWHREIAVNLTGVFHTCRATVPLLLSNGYGRIVNVSSMTAKDGSPHQAGYVASKAGVLAFTKTLGRELAESNILVNAITPTLFETPLYRQWADQQDPAVSAWAVSRIPMKRVGRPEEAAAMIAWMASEDCSFTTGMTFDVSGGRASY